MINLEKSQPAPASLAAEKSRASGSYREPDVIERLHADFFGKCYICENAPLTSVNVEHFVPHREDRDRKFDWDNLFLACGHCNNTKQTRSEFNSILKCTDWNDPIIASIRCDFEPWPKERPRFVALVDDERTRNTANLLNDVFNGNTPIKEIESNSLRDLLLEEMKEFQALLLAFFERGTPETERARLREQIEQHLAPSSAFCAFKIWAIRRRDLLEREFGPAYACHQSSSTSNGVGP